MQLHHALRATGAVRQFTDAPVDPATIYDILDAARFAPSGGNRQPWRVAVVGLPDDHALVATTVLGVPVERAAVLPRRPVAEFTNLDRFFGPPFAG